MDIDSDGDLDLLVGEKYESVHYYQRQSDGSLNEQPLLVKLEKPDPNLAYMSISPSFADWNGDGACDIILGSDVYKSGRPFPLRFYVNKGNATNPVFDDYDTLKDKSGAVIQAVCARVAAGDLNMDGKRDLVVGDRKVNVTWYKNTGTNANPEFEPYTLIPNAQLGISEKPNFMQNNGFGYATPRIYDWNKDGSPDLLLSGYPSGEIWIYINDTPTPINTIPNTVSCLHQSFETVYRLSGIQISYSVLKASQVIIKLLDTRGKVVTVMANTFNKAGIHQVNLNCNNVSKGIYLVQLQTNKTRTVEKIIITK